MSKVTIIGLIASFLALISMITLLSIDSHFPFYQWPYEAFQGLVFSLAWGFGFSVGLSYLVSAVFILVFLAIVFAIGSTISRCFFERK